MKYTIEELRDMTEGQSFDRKSILIEPKALANINGQCGRWNDCNRHIRQDPLR